MRSPQGQLVETYHALALGREAEKIICLKYGS